MISFFDEKLSFLFVFSFFPVSCFLKVVLFNLLLHVEHGKATVNDFTVLDEEED